MLDALMNNLAQSGFGQFMQAQALHLLAPELVIFLSLLFVVVVSVSNNPNQRSTAWGLSLWGVTLAFLVSLSHYLLFFHGLSGIFQPILFGMAQGDAFSQLSRSLILLASVIVLLMCRRYVKAETEEAGLPISAEFYALLLTALLGALFVCSASDWVMIFVALETLGIASYMMVGYLRGDRLSSEASLKYLVYGAASSALLLFGISLVYGLSGGSTSLYALPQVLNQSNETLTALKPLMPLMWVLLVAGIGFKLSVAPFHFWAPDVYEGAPTPVTAFLSVVSKIAGFALAIRVFSLGMSVYPPLAGLLAVVSVASMVWGNTVALFQTNAKRLLAYSTIAHAGYLLLGLVVLSDAGVASLLYYLMAYVFMNLGAFACVMQANKVLGTDDLSAYAGLVRKKPLLSLMFTVFLLALSGIPITAGFFAKFFLFQAVASTDITRLGLVIVALLASTVSLYYYLNVVRLMLIASPSPEVEAYEEAPGLRFKLGSLGLAVAISFVGTVVLGFYANPLFNLCVESVQGLQQSSQAGVMLSSNR